MPPVEVNQYSEKLKKLPTLHEQSIRELSVGLNDFGLQNRNDAAYKKEIEKYVMAMNTVIRPISDMNPEKKVAEAIKTLNGLQDFLLREKDGKTNYQRIFDECDKPENERKIELDVKTLRNGLKCLQNHLELDLNINEIDPVLKNLNTDEIVLDDQRPSLAPDFEENEKPNIIVGSENIEREENLEPEKPKPVSGEAFLALATKKDNFTYSISNDHKAVGAMLTEIFKAKTYYSDVIESEGQKVHGADQKKLDEANVMYKALDNFYNNAKNLNDFNSNGYIPEAEDVQVTLDDVGSFKDFLVGGKGMTNYQRLDEAADKKGNKIVRTDVILKGLDVLEKTLHLGLDTKEIVNAKPEQDLEFNDEGFGADDNNIIAPKKQNVKKQEQIKDAVKWLEDWKKDFNDHINELKQQPGYPKVHFMRIMASRYLAESEIGHVDKLYHKPMTLKQIDEKAKELYDNNEYFRKFIDKISTEPKYRTVAEKCAGSGHGGGLDKMFIRYLNAQPAGTLKNDEMIQRYMPTVKDRIEELQRQAKASREKGLTPSTEIAEILTLRNMIDAQRDSKNTLEKQIPTVKEGEKTLNDIVGELAVKEEFMNISRDPVVLGRIEKGHGGLMIERMRELNISDGKQRNFTDPEKAIAHGTYGGKMEANRALAAELKETILDHYDQMNANEANEIRHKVENLLAQQVTLATMASKKTNGENKDIEWSKVNSETQKVANGREFRMAIFPTSGKVDCLSALAILTDKQPLEVPREVAQKIGQFKSLEEASKKAKKAAGKPNAENKGPKEGPAFDGDDLEKNVEEFKKNMLKGKGGMGLN